MAITFNADTSNGLVITPDTSGDLSFQSSGSNIFTIDSSGNTVFSGALSWSGDLAVDTNTLYVDATNNNVGIGTSSIGANYKLSVNGTGNFYNGVSGLGRVFFGDPSDSSGYIGLYRSLLGAANSTTAGNGLNFASIDGYTFNTGAVAFGAQTERMRIDGSTGSVRIGSNNAYGLNEKLMIYGSSTANQPTIISSKEASGTVSSNHFLFQNTNGTVGSVVTSGSATSYNTSSDYRLKNNVAPMSGSIDRLKQLKPSTWSWVQDGSHGEGFLAHEAQEVVPESIHGTKDAMRTEEYEVNNGKHKTKRRYIW
jgi:hypothetical protein